MLSGQTKKVLVKEYVQVAGSIGGASMKPGRADGTVKIDPAI
jgi:hypothetical protein